MSVHQIITGALNRGENVFSVGLVDGINFTVCAVGCDVVILDCEFKRVQVIPGCSTGFVQVTSVAGCNESGKIAAAFYDFVRIYKPLPLSDTDSQGESETLNYRWFEASAFPVSSLVTCLSWNLDGFRLLVSTEAKLQMFQHHALTEYCTLTEGIERQYSSGVRFGIETEIPVPSEETSTASSAWDCVWSSKLDSPLRQVRFSPDGSMFASCGKNDKVVKVWFCDSTEQKKNGDGLSYNFLLLRHPKEVIGFEWRKSGRYIFRGFVANILLTWCQDHISRIWCETSPASECDWGQSYRTSEPTAQATLPDTDAQRPFHPKYLHRTFLHRFKHLRRKKKVKHDSANVNSSYSRSLGLSTDTFATCGDELSNYVHFHLSASINANTDCLLVPSVDRCMFDTTMAVHWLNNKELVFSEGAEKLIVEALGAESCSRLAAAPDGRLASTTDLKKQESERPTPVTPTLGSPLQPSQPQMKDNIDMKFDALLRDWQQTYDVLFAIHPVDGSLLIWTVEYLDCITRQAQVSFASRLPLAFPLNDAASLHHNLALLNSKGQSYWNVTHNEYDNIASSEFGAQSSCNKVYLLTTHQNGTLNLWNLNVDEKSNYSLILGVTHKSRMCGHRFMVKRVACHPILPLFLTTSHHNVRRKKFDHEQSQQQEQQQQNEVSSEMTKADVQLFGSELILWQVVPVGPLRKTGGVSELSRINSPELSAFSNVAWIPSVLPSSTLGRSSNSASSCFIASDGQCLRVYQAVLDARSLLSDMNYVKQFLPISRSSSTDFDVFESVRNRRQSVDVVLNIVSTQSTARPGCIIGLDPISDAIHNWRHVQLMHVFHEEVVMTDTHIPSSVVSDKLLHSDSSCLDRSKEATFHDRFYLVLLEKSKNPSVAKPTIHMWLVGLVAQSNCDSPVFRPGIRGILLFAKHIRHRAYYSGETDDTTGGGSSVCSQSLDLPEGVRVIDCCPSVSHLSSSSLYPSCRAPYLLATACSDDRTRFWRCDVSMDKDSTLTYKWLEWRMFNEFGESSFEVEGSVLRVSCAYSGRIACAFDPGGLPQKSDDVNSVNVNVTVHECESTGGIEWIEEDTIRLHNIPIQRIAYFPSDTESFSLLWEDPSEVFPSLADKKQNSLSKHIPPVTNVNVTTKAGVRSCYVPGKGDTDIRLRDVVRLAWISAEDGSHLLTVGVGSLIFLYAPVAEDVAQHFVALMKESEQVNPKRRKLLRKASTIAAQVKKVVRWICLRCVELESADGLPPVPRMLSWVRHGIMVVGLDTEMRIYSQWNMSQPNAIANKSSLKLQPSGEDALSGLAKIVPSSAQQHLTTSHSVLDFMRKAKKTESAVNLKRLPAKKHDAKDKTESWSERFLGLVTYEGLFDAARVAMPLLPQYHPRQLIELLRAGKISMVKAILLHMLCSIRQYGTAKIAKTTSDSETSDSGDRPANRRPSITLMDIGIMSNEEVTAEYFEVDFIAPLPLYSLIYPEVGESEKAISKTNTNTSQNVADMLWSDYEAQQMKDSLVLNMYDTGMEEEPASDHEPTSFTAKEALQLSHLLTHVHLPGLTSVDQLHLLAIADTVCSFSADAVEEKAWYFSGMSKQSIFPLINVDIHGYDAESTATAVDTCGLRYLMAVRHYEYLLRCLPFKQRVVLRQKGLPSANVIWALHSETESELLESLSCMQRKKPTWDELRSLGVGWWLKNVQILRTCFEKIAKSAFQAKNDPMDAALFYLAMKKKTVLVHLFKTVKDAKMTDFLSNDFSQDKWKKAALKNAFVLISKQRFEHAVAFFLLGNALDDAVKVCLDSMNDIQLAVVIFRLFSSDEAVAEERLRHLLCNEVLKCSADDDFSDPDTTKRCQDPFLRSIVFWYLKEYALAASTFLTETDLRARSDLISAEYSSSDVFNFYVYLRTHPLVLRKRLEDNGIKIASTEQFVKIAQHLARQISAIERKLFFNTASTHLQCGCPLLAIEVLSKLPRPPPPSDYVPGPFLELLSAEASRKTTAASLANGVQPAKPFATPATGKEEAVDWSFDINTPSRVDLSNRFNLPKLELDLEEEDDIDEADQTSDAKSSSSSTTQEADDAGFCSASTKDDGGQFDVIAQILKLISCMKILTEELACVVSGYEVDGGQLRAQLYLWLEKEMEMLKLLCDYKVDERQLEDETSETNHFFVSLSVASAGAAAELHEAIQQDRQKLAIRWQRTVRMRRWLAAHQQVLRTLTYFCSLHSSSNVGLASAGMELLLLLQELNQNLSVSRSQLTSRLPVFGTFPLMSSSLASVKSDIALPLRNVINQTSDILKTLAELQKPPKYQEHLSEMYLMYTLSQCLSACMYGSLCDMSSVPISKMLAKENSFLLHKVNDDSICEGDLPEVVTNPEKWPGVDCSPHTLSGDRDEDVPNLLVLLVESWAAIFLSLFTFCLCTYDSRWLYRLVAHPVNAQLFSTIFGGGGHRSMLVDVQNSQLRRQSCKSSDTYETATSDGTVEQLDPAKLRAKFHSKVLGHRDRSNSTVQLTADGRQVILTTKTEWVQPRKSVISFYMTKPCLGKDAEEEFEYDSEESNSSEDDSAEEEEDEEKSEHAKQHSDSNSYAWLILRLALVRQVQYRIKQFLAIAGFELTEMGGISPLIYGCLNMLERWVASLNDELENYPGGCPENFLPSAGVANEAGGPSLHRFRVILEPNNTPFPSGDRSTLPVRRLWLFLVRQEHLMDVFIRCIFKSKNAVKIGEVAASSGPYLHSEAFKVIQREHDPITAFAICPNRFGMIAISSGRELQEMDISPLLSPNADWLSDPTELELMMTGLKKNPLVDNDDYLLVNAQEKQGTLVTGRGTTYLCKRLVPGVRRMEAHPTMPYYLSGSTDGSVRLWEWGVGQPRYTPRTAGHFAKVTQTRFSAQGSKFGVTDADGCLSLWHIGTGTTLKKPFYNVKCHAKTCNDFVFLGQSSSLLATAGQGSLESSVALWDTLLPPSRSNVHCWNCHSDSINCLAYCPNQQILLGGGKHGDVSIWDVRQRQLRMTVKAFDSSAVRSMAVDPMFIYLAVGSADGDIKIFVLSSVPQMIYHFPSEHASRSTFSLRSVGSAQTQGVQMIYIDSQLRLYSCGADCSLKLRQLYAT
ncbi:Protein RBC-1, isoform a [Trichuris trichiura]|uniref:Protein RBC-1, isoform a n=1 Tax=Trichuris trichiura TaxID=36087 RepID=A0A077YX15_TRITR|nr:Protein RBC-1, isoform a [Trichuris trichiura]